MAATRVTHVASPLEEGSVIICTVTSSGNAAAAWVQQVCSTYRLCEHDVFAGLDVEWRPSYGRARNPAALLQLCVQNRCLVFQLLHADYIPQALADSLVDPRWSFVGVGVDADAVRLGNDYGLQVANTVDLRGLAAGQLRMPELRQAGLVRLAHAVTGVNIEKPQRVRMSAWDAYRLSDEQIHYACIDALVSFQAGLILFNGGS
ncbi:Werner Syndrome-like exonuclease [Brachypodium distachyon]|uniref:3'-5' exonuclease domain-containing protein n=1 Tax=Brachypodium distachyon TaxID=15368 RepID=I1HQ23_BRADI|nr:Werner Syndrome-like exonuclease [Brachypodium distachyon]PNT72530.1 hypothetical protein BRADI_2g45640v3 [Brachypodium distachyon]|eukprot:XP_003566956.1 Werner Syndrome-like exonuclease [Brachypodium distachyon]